MVKSETARLDAVFHALADEPRRSILRDVAAGEKTVSDVVRPLCDVTDRFLEAPECARLQFPANLRWSNDDPFSML